MAYVAVEVRLERELRAAGFAVGRQVGSDCSAASGRPIPPARGETPVLGGIELTDARSENPDHQAIRVVSHNFLMGRHVTQHFEVDARRVSSVPASLAVLALETVRAAFIDLADQDTSTRSPHEEGAQQWAKQPLLQSHLPKRWTAGASVLAFTDATSRTTTLLPTLHLALAKNDWGGRLSIAGGSPGWRFQKQDGAATVRMNHAVLAVAYRSSGTRWQPFAVAGAGVGCSLIAGENPASGFVTNKHLVWSPMAMAGFGIAFLPTHRFALILEGDAIAATRAPKVKIGDELLGPVGALVLATSLGFEVQF